MQRVQNKRGHVFQALLRVRFTERGKAWELPVRRRSIERLHRLQIGILDALCNHLQPAVVHARNVFPLDMHLLRLEILKSIAAVSKPVVRPITVIRFIITVDAGCDCGLNGDDIRRLARADHVEHEIQVEIVDAGHRPAGRLARQIAPDLLAERLGIRLCPLATGVIRARKAAQIKRLCRHTVGHDLHLYGSGRVSVAAADCPV